MTGRVKDYRSTGLGWNLILVILNRKFKLDNHNDAVNFIRRLLPLSFVKRDSSLKECNSQMLILAYAAIKRLGDTIKYINFL